MRFLEKLNRRATRRGLILRCVGGGVAGLIIGLLGWLGTDTPAVAGYFVLPWMALSGAVAAGAVYWQVPDGGGEA
jgi:hypothetical protein